QSRSKARWLRAFGRAREDLIAVGPSCTVVSMDAPLAAPFGQEQIGRALRQQTTRRKPDQVVQDALDAAWPVPQQVGGKYRDRGQAGLLVGAKEGGARAWCVGVGVGGLRLGGRDKRG